MTPQDEKYIELFASLMIDKIKEVDSNWKKPWFDTSIPFVKNVQGYLYTGVNEMFLRLVSQETNQKPIFLSFFQAKELGCNIIKGRSAYPTVFYKPILRSEDELKEIADSKGLKVEELTNQETIKYTIRKYNNVFNIDDTNLKDVRPDLYEKLSESVKMLEPTNIVDIPEIDNIIKNNSWICPIKIQDSDKAFFLPKDDCPFIVMPLKEQFPNQEQFYGTLLHEMAHSTMIEHPRKELDYAHEELVAELSSAYAMSQLGVGLPIKEENAKYLKGWIKHISEKPEVILDITKHVTKAIDVINRHINPNRALLIENNKKLYEEQKSKNNISNKESIKSSSKKVNNRYNKSKKFKL